MYLTETDILGLRPYTHADDSDWYRCWQDAGTHKGYNMIFEQSFEQIDAFDISRFKFWVVIEDKRTGQSVGTIRLGLDPVCPDLALWIWPEHRGQKYGIQAYTLALRYVFEQFDYPMLSAGVFQDNKASLCIMKKLGFVHCPEGDETEPNCFTGEETTQLEFRVEREAFLKNHG